MPPKRKPQPPTKPKPSAPSVRRIKVGKRGAVYTVTNTGARRYRKKIGKVKLPRLKLTSNEKKRQKAALKQISPLKKKLTQKSPFPKRTRSRSRSRSRSSSKSKSSSLLSTLSSLVSN